MRDCLPECWKEVMSNRLRAALLVGLIALIVVVVTGCGASDDGGASAPKATKEEQAFLKGMIPHHESAVEMAEMAKEHGQHKEIKQLVSNIISDQSREIRRMERIYKRLNGEEIIPDPSAHEQLGLSAKAAGMEHMDMESLTRAKPFDRIFIDEMVGHHQGAIRMAHAVMDKAKDSEIKQLANSVVETQTSEINDMNKWRKTWYGAPLPAGGAPRAGETPEGEEGATTVEGGGHEGH